MIDSNKNKSICAVPFVSTMVNTDTTIRYCCMVKGNSNKIKDYSDESGKTFYTCKDNFIKDAWNSRDMRDIRNAMLSGESIEGCKICYLQEESGGISNRQHSIKEWEWRLGKEELNNRFEIARQNNGIIFEAPVYLDLRLGNLCNLKCRMCNPWNSSQIAKEHFELNAADEKYAEIFKKTFGRFPIEVMENQQWFDHDILWDQVIDLIPILKKVYMTGGEPTLIKNNFKFMEECISRGRKDIILFFNTNCTNINKKFLNLISQFDEVHINASLDGVREVNNYIRSSSEWDLLYSNLEKIARMNNVHLGITPTIQVYNVFDIVNILKMVETLNNSNIDMRNKIFIDFLINVHPHHLNIDILPESLKLEAINEINQYLSDQHNHATMTYQSLSTIIGLLNRAQCENAIDQIKILKTYTSILDNHRKQSFMVLDKRIVELLND